VLADLRSRATTHTVVVGNGVVLDARGDLDLGRTRRLPNRAQRRALRGLYASCAHPGLSCPLQPNRSCITSFGGRNGGFTDLAATCCRYVNCTHQRVASRRLAVHHHSSANVDHPTSRRSGDDNRTTQQGMRGEHAIRTEGDRPRRRALSVPVVRHDHTGAAVGCELLDTVTGAPVSGRSTSSKKSLPLSSTTMNAGSPGPRSSRRPPCRARGIRAPRPW
jgi:hypothetical protein